MAIRQADRSENLLSGLLKHRSGQAIACASVVAPCWPADFLPEPGQTIFQPDLPRNPVPDIVRQPSVGGGSNSTSPCSKPKPLSPTMPGQTCGTDSAAPDRKRGECTHRPEGSALCCREATSLQDNAVDQAASTHRRHHSPCKQLRPVLAEPVPRLCGMQVRNAAPGLQAHQTGKTILLRSRCTSPPDVTAFFSQK